MINAVALTGAAASEIEKVEACGQPKLQSWVCASVYDLTGSQNVAKAADFFSPVLKSVVLVAVAYVAVLVSRRLIGRTVRKLSKEETGKQISALKKRTGISKIEISVQETDRRALRAETLGAVMRSIAAAVIWITTTMMILRELGVNLAAIGLSISIIGVALGFGSQSLVKDCLSGIFMILEDQYGVGDLIDAEVATGTVEGLGLRTLRLRDSDGTVWHIPNGEIRRVGNKSKQRTNP